MWTPRRENENLLLLLLTGTPLRVRSISCSVLLQELLHLLLLLRLVLLILLVPLLREDAICAPTGAGLLLLLLLFIRWIRVLLQWWWWYLLLLLLLRRYYLLLLLQQVPCVCPHSKLGAAVTPHSRAARILVCGRGCCCRCCLFWF